jgi:hypothetical protein
MKTIFLLTEQIAAGKAAAAFIIRLVDLVLELEPLRPGGVADGKSPRQSRHQVQGHAQGEGTRLRGGKNSHIIAKKKFFCSKDFLFRRTCNCILVPIREQLI